MPLPRRLPIAAALAFGLTWAPGNSSALAQDGWKPFSSAPSRAGTQRPPGIEAQPLPPVAPGPPPASGPYDRPAPRGSSIERSDLEPVGAPDASGLPLELWRGLDMQGLEGLLSALELPPRSPTLHQLWKRMLLSAATPPSGAPSAEHFLAVRLEALYRSGLLAEMGEIVGDGSAASNPVVAALLARREIGLGDAARGCEHIKRLANPRGGLPERLRGEAQLLAGYCAAVAGDRAGAGLAAGLAREEGLEADLPLSILAGFSDDTKPRLVLPKRMLLLDYRFLALLGPVNAKQLVERAEAALYAVLARDAKSDPHTVVAAAEAALRINALEPQAVAEIYGRQSPGAAQAEADPQLRRAFYFRAAGISPSPPQRARFLRALLDDARRGGYGLQMAQVAASLLGNEMPGPDAGLLAETGAEAMLASGRIAEARAWAQAGPGGLPHWVALIDVVDPARRSWRTGTLAVLEDMALRGRLGGDVLHRLATVLDALDIDVPVPLWDAANRTPQPTGGHLPETGVLAELAGAAKARDTARTILLAMRTLGPAGADGANLLALGDAIRALRKVGLEAEARRLGLEALLPIWPRFAGP